MTQNKKASPNACNADVHMQISGTIALKKFGCYVQEFEIGKSKMIFFLRDFKYTAPGESEICMLTNYSFLFSGDHQDFGMDGKVFVNINYLREATDQEREELLQLTKKYIEEVNNLIELNNKNTISW